MSAPSIPLGVRLCQASAPPRDRGLLDTLERARAGYWLAMDRHDPSAADAHAAHYRAALRRAYLGPSLDALTRRLERESAALCQAMLEQEARIATLERELLGEGWTETACENFHSDKSTPEQALVPDRGDL